MNPTLTILTIVSTNWLPMSIETPTGHGTTTQVEKEVGIVLSNRYAKVTWDGNTNIMLLSSEPLLPKSLLIRSKPKLELATNWSIQPMLKIPGWTYTNGAWLFRNPS